MAASLLASAKAVNQAKQMTLPGFEKYVSGCSYESYEPLEYYEMKA